MMKGLVRAVSIAPKKGIKKDNVDEARLVEECGIEHDAHAGSGHRQVSLLAMESIDSMRAKLPDLHPGIFAENITTEGITLVNLPVGTTIRIGDDAVLSVTQIGKVCHSRCHIYYEAGDCVMPKEGIFARVLQGGMIRPGDTITVDTSG